MTEIFDPPKMNEKPKIVLIPVPWDATASYKKGTAKAPASILKASQQLDLYDQELGPAYLPGIHLEKENTEISNWNESAKSNPTPENINTLSEKLNQWIYQESKKLTEDGHWIGIIGGEHSVPYGAIKALSEKFSDFGILHIDAHHDLREAYQGYTHSHASIMYNCMKDFSQIKQLVSIGVRDFCEEEHTLAKSSSNRITTYYDSDLSNLKFQGRSFEKTVHEIIQRLPDHVYISFDIDGLDPRFCPSTGTPVPGGLEFSEAVYILKSIAKSGRKIIGFDLCEVAPGPHSEWDANVGMRMLYQLCGWLFRSQGEIYRGFTSSHGQNFRSIRSRPIC